MSSKTRIVKTFDGLYDRIAEIWIEFRCCEICGIEKTCIVSDTSEGEYEDTALCADCVKKECDKGY